MSEHLRLLLPVALLATTTFTGVASAAPPDQADAVQAMASDVYVVVGAALRSAATLGSPPAPDAILYNVVGTRLPAGADDPLTWAGWSAATATSRVARIGGARGAPNRRPALHAVIGPRRGLLGLLVHRRTGLGATPVPGCRTPAPA